MSEKNSLKAQRDYHLNMLKFFTSNGLQDEAAVQLQALKWLESAAWSKK